MERNQAGYVRSRPVVDVKFDCDADVPNLYMSLKPGLLITAGSFWKLPSIYGDIARCIALPYFELPYTRLLTAWGPVQIPVGDGMSQDYQCHGEPIDRKAK